MRRHPVGDNTGNSPSITRTRANASQNVSSLKVHFFGVAEPGSAGTAGPALPRKTLKNSDEDGSTTITSLFLPRLAL